MEEVKKQVIPKKPSIKQRYLAAAGQEVGMDYFLYTCFEEEKTCAALTGKHFKINNKKKYPGLQGQREITGDLDAVIGEIMQWYHSTYPQLAGSAVLDYAVHSEIVGPFIGLLTDVQDLFRLKGEPLLRVLPSGSEVAEDPSWAKVLTQLQGHFPHYYRFMAAYISWITKSAVAAPLDLTSVPPVGRYLQLLHEARRRAERKAQQAAYPAGARSYGDRPERSEGGSSRSSGRRDDARREERGHSGRHEGARGRTSGNEDYLKEVEQGVAKLKKNLLLKQVVLKPQNSFIRHEQHRKINELGLTSDSTGEGAQRAVKIMRASKKDKTAKK
jgi:hypothetical protein